MLDINNVTLLISALGIPALAGVMLTYFPTRREFSAHLREDDDRFRIGEKTLDEIKQLIRDTKNDIIREVKNGHSKGE